MSSLNLWNNIYIYIYISSVHPSPRVRPVAVVVRCPSVRPVVRPVVRSSSSVPSTSRSMCRMGSITLRIRVRVPRWSRSKEMISKVGPSAAMKQFGPEVAGAFTYDALFHCAHSAAWRKQNPTLEPAMYAKLGRTRLTLAQDLDVLPNLGFEKWIPHHFISPFAGKHFAFVESRFNQNDVSINPPLAAWHASNRAQGWSYPPFRMCE